MELLIWYSYNHQCFKTRIGNLGFDSDIGYINGFNEVLVQVIPLYKFKIPIRYKVINLLQRVIDRLERKPCQPVNIKKSKDYPWWKV